MNHAKQEGLSPQIKLPYTGQVKVWVFLGPFGGKVGSFSNLKARS